MKWNRRYPRIGIENITDALEFSHLRAVEIGFGESCLCISDGAHGSLAVRRVNGSIIQTTMTFRGQKTIQRINIDTVGRKINGRK